MTGGLKRISWLSEVQFHNRETASLLILCKNRGKALDYYTRTVFEFVSGDIGAQATVCGGGRYDGLISQMGGPNVPSLGFGMGIERLMLVLENTGVELPKAPTPDLYIAPLGSAAQLKASEICAELRMDGFKVETDICGRSLKAQMKYASKIGAKYTLVLGDDEIEKDSASLKNMETGETTNVRLVKLTSALFSAINSSVIEKMAESFMKEQNL